MKKLVIHVGAHKTGSTFIQNTIRDNESDLMKYGVGYFGGEDARLNFTRDILYPAVGLRKKNRECISYKQECKKIISNRASDCATLFVSNENILGFCDLIKSNGFIYPKAAEVAKFLSLLREDWDVKVIISIRDYADFIESSYIQKIKEGFSYSFFEYSSMTTLEKVSWVATVETLRDSFGHDNVWVFRYEDFKENPELYMDKLGGFVFDNKVKLKMESKKNINPSYSTVALELARQANEILPKKDLKDYREFLTRRFPNAKYGRPKLFSEADKSAFRKKYREDCDYLSI